MNAAQKTARDFREAHGYWSEYPGHPLEDWRSEITNDYTRQGYWEWIHNREEENYGTGDSEED